MKRWTQDAKVDSIKDYHGIDVKGSAKSQCESVSLIWVTNVFKLTHLQHREMMYEHVDKCFDKLLKHLQETKNVQKSIRKEKKKKISK